MPLVYSAATQAAPVGEGGRACVSPCVRAPGVSEGINATAHAQLPFFSPPRQLRDREPSPGGKDDFFFRVALGVFVCAANTGLLGELEGRECL